jgi:hypothetical protein
VAIAVVVVRRSSNRTKAAIDSSGEINVASVHTGVHNVNRYALAAFYIVEIVGLI